MCRLCCAVAAVRALLGDARARGHARRGPPEVRRAPREQRRAASRARVRHRAAAPALRWSTCALTLIL